MRPSGGLSQRWSIARSAQYTCALVPLTLDASPLDWHPLSLCQRPDAAATGPSAIDGWRSHAYRGGVEHSTSDEQAALRDYLRDGGLVKPTTAMVNRSSFWALLMDARCTAGRDPGTGRVVDPARSESWLAVMGYLCWFDQVGAAVHLAGETGSSRGFHRCLLQFSDVSSKDRSALLGLRNAFAHNYGLIAHHRRRQEHYAFALDVDGPLIEHPDTAWDGGFPVPPSVTTIVGLRELGDLAEIVKTRVLAAQAAGELMPALPPAELCDRFLFTYIR